jgi:hypothetical protein
MLTCLTICILHGIRVVADLPKSNCCIGRGVPVVMEEKKAIPLQWNGL